MTQAFNANLPKVSYMKAIDVWMLMLWVLHSVITSHLLIRFVMQLIVQLLRICLNGRILLCAAVVENEITRVVQLKVETGKDREANARVAKPRPED